MLVMLILNGCSKKEKKEGAVTPTPRPKIIKKGAKIVQPVRIFYSSKYSDGSQWENGIDKKKKDAFFFIVPKKNLTPILPGFTLKFAKTGAASVLKVYRMEKDNQSLLFVTVDKTLDPKGDGNHNPISVKSISIQASAFSRGNDWLNGVSLKQAGMFFFVLEAQDAIPIMAGDRLIFAKTGEAVIKKVYRMAGQGKYSNIIVTVDRPIDPVGDGNPNSITVRITD